MGQVDNKTKFAIIGAVLVPCFGRLALHGSGHEHDYYRYFVPLFVGGLAGFLIGLMKDRWAKLHKNLESLVEDRTKELRDEIKERKRVEDALREAHEEMEHRVDERTEELKIANEKLKREIEDRKRATVAITKAKEEWERTFNAATDLIAILDVRHRIVRVNKAMADRMCTTPDEAVGLTCYEHVHGADEPPSFCPHSKVLADSREHLAEIHEERLGGDFAISVSPLNDAEGRLIGSVHVARDITERKRAQEALKEYSERLEEMVEKRTQELRDAQKELIKRERLSVLGQVTATVSHELRNPLGVIRSSTFYLESKLSDADDKIRKHLQRIGQQVGLCDTIVGDLLEYTRGRRSEMVEGEINHWLEEVLDQITIPEPVSLVCDMSAVLPMVCFDKEKMRRVMINMVANAIQAVLARQESMKDEDGRYQPQVKLSASVVENSVRIEVEDNGIGMNDETAGRAFDPLFTTRARGTGLGLAIVKKIIEEHGGSVSLKSEPDRRTKVTVKIPLLTRQQEQADGK